MKGKKRRCQISHSKFKLQLPHLPGGLCHNITFKNGKRT